jgi:hypothetical protein
MSRIILSKHDDGSDHFVVGWDHPCRGAFWQEYASPAEIENAKGYLEHITPNDTHEFNRFSGIVETGIKRDGGMFHGIPINTLCNSVPEELREHITNKVTDLLTTHSRNPDSGYKVDRIIDLTEDYK